MQETRELGTDVQGSWIAPLRSNAVPKVSIIMPVYNSAPYLEEALSSVRNQTLRDWELLCVDDGSTDESLEMLLDAAKSDERIAVYAQANAGQGRARNVGLETAQGEYIYFFDSDDYIDAQTLEVLYERASTQNLDMLLFDAVPFCNEERLGTVHKAYEKMYARKRSYEEVTDGPHLFTEMREEKDYVVSPCLIFTRSAHIRNNSLRFPEGIIHEDNLYTLKCLLKAKRTAHIQRELYHRRVRTGSTTTKPLSFANCYGYFRCILGILSLYEELNASLSTTACEEVSALVAEYAKEAQAIFRAIPDRDSWHDLVPNHELPLFESLVVFPACAYARIEKRNRDLTGSFSYCIGRFLTWPVRKLKRLILSSGN